MYHAPQAPDMLVVQLKVGVWDSPYSMRIFFVHEDVC